MHEINHNQKHQNGPWYVKYGSMFNKYNDGIMLDEDIAILIDSCPEDDRGIVLKVGKYENVLKYFNSLIEKYNKNNIPEYYETMSIIKFNVMFEGVEENPKGFKPNGYNFTVDEICTIINWFLNCIGAEMDKFLHLSLDEAKAKIIKLQEIGF